MSEKKLIVAVDYSILKMRDFAERLRIAHALSDEKIVKGEIKAVIDDIQLATNALEGTRDE